MEIACSKGLSGVTKFFAKYCAFLRLYTVTVFSVQGGEIESLEDGSFVSELSISAQAACERSALRQEQALMRCRLQEAARQAKSDACECSFPSTFTFQTFTLHIFTFTSSLFKFLNRFHTQLDCVGRLHFGSFTNPQLFISTLPTCALWSTSRFDYGSTCRGQITIGPLGCLEERLCKNGSRTT